MDQKEIDEIDEMLKADLASIDEYYDVINGKVVVDKTGKIL